MSESGARTEEAFRHSPPRSPFIMKLVQHRPEVFTNEVTNAVVGAWLIFPECCFPFFLQDAPVGAATEFKFFTFDGNFEKPTFGESVCPWAHGCDPINQQQRCHFFVKDGLCYHTPDSKQPNAVIPLKEFR